MNDGKIIIDKIIAEAEEVAKASLAKGQKEADAVLKAAQEKVNKELDVFDRNAQAEAEKGCRKGDFRRTDAGEKSHSGNEAGNSCGNDCGGGKKDCFLWTMRHTRRSSAVC